VAVQDKKTSEHIKLIKLDEKNHVEEPFLAQLEELGWEVVRLETKQNPGEIFRDSFTEVVMLSVLRESLRTINPWLENDQVEEVIKCLTAALLR
jgi:type I restriction enzyme, R subunit